MNERIMTGRNAGLRRVRMTRETGQSVVLSNLDSNERGRAMQIEVRISQVCAGGTAILEIVTDADSGIQVMAKEAADARRSLGSAPAGSTAS